MIDKLEAGVKYKLINKSGYIAYHRFNARYVDLFLDEDGCFTFDKVMGSGNGFIDDYAVIGKSTGEYKFLSKFDDEVTNSTITEYRVIRKASKHQVCDWRKGEKLYEDEYGTLVRNEKRTKFYTDIVEWREVEKPVTLEDIANKLDSFNFPFSDKEREELFEMAAKYKQSKGDK